MVDCQRSLSCLIACNATASNKRTNKRNLENIWFMTPNLGGWERPTQLIGPYWSYISFINIQYSAEVIHPLGIHKILRILEPFVEWSQVIQRILDHALRETPCSLGSAIETLRWAAAFC